MKKIVFTLGILALYVHNAWGQCLPCTPPDPMNYQLPGGKFDNGFYPESDTAYVGTPYDQEIKIVFPYDTTVQPFGNVKFTEFKVDSIKFIPNGLQLVLDQADNTYNPANSNVPAVGCAHVCGNPTTTNNVTDSVEIFLTVRVSSPFAPAQQAKAKYHLRVLSGTSKQSAWLAGIKYEVYPNPATDKAILHYAVDFVTDVNIQIVDITGRVVKTIYQNGVHPGDYYIDIMDESYSNGIYLVKIKTDKGEVSTKFIKQ